MFDFIVVLGSFIDIMMSEIDKAEPDRMNEVKKTEIKTEKVHILLTIFAFGR